MLVCGCLENLGEVREGWAWGGVQGVVVDGGAACCGEAGVEVAAYGRRGTGVAGGDRSVEEFTGALRRSVRQGKRGVCLLFGGREKEREGSDGTGKSDFG